VELVGYCNVNIEQPSKHRANKITKHTTFPQFPQEGPEGTHNANVTSPIVLASSHTDTGRGWSANFT
jgi:hypothetical protein